MYAFVYWNSHKKCWSVKALEGENKGIVVAHASCVLMSSCKFQVSAKVRDRVRETGCKEVHAGVVGFVTGLEGFPGTGTVGYGMHLENERLANNLQRRGIAIGYNPKVNDAFVIKASGEAVTDAGIVYMASDRGVYATLAKNGERQLGRWIIESGEHTGDYSPGSEGRVMSIFDTKTGRYLDYLYSKLKPAEINVIRLEVGYLTPEEV